MTSRTSRYLSCRRAASSIFATPSEPTWKGAGRTTMRTWSGYDASNCLTGSCMAAQVSHAGSKNSTTVTRAWAAPPEEPPAGHAEDDLPEHAGGRRDRRVQVVSVVLVLRLVGGELGEKDGRLGPVDSDVHEPGDVVQGADGVGGAGRVRDEEGHDGRLPGDGHPAEGPRRRSSRRGSPATRPARPSFPPLPALATLESARMPDGTPASAGDGATGPPGSRKETSAATAIDGRSGARSTPYGVRTQPRASVPVTAQLPRR